MDLHIAQLIPTVVGTALAAGSGRLGATAAAVVSLIGVIVGGLAVARGSRPRLADDDRAEDGRRGSAAVLLGLLGAVSGGLVVALSDGGVGTGNGRGGAIVAIALGLVGAGLGGAARIRRRQVA